MKCNLILIHKGIQFCFFPNIYKYPGMGDLRSIVHQRSYTQQKHSEPGFHKTAGNMIDIQFI